MFYCLILTFCIISQQWNYAQRKTYCNPLNLDYGYTPIPNFTNWGKHRATADPVIVNYKGTYFLFSTNQWGYWWSDDLAKWNFLSRKFLRPWNQSYDELCAPGVGIIGDTMIVFGSTYNSNFTLWMSTDPKKNEWKPLVDSFEIGGWDPAFFTDDDGRFYMYNGSSNRWPLYGIELDRKTFKPVGTRKELYFLESWRYGWQRFGEHQDNTFLDPFIEGAFITKHNGKYYLQYGAPGTEFSGYADGVAVGNEPLGWFASQSDPLSMKSGGFTRGAGHGATFKDNFNNYWHTSTIAIAVKNNFERRIGLWPAGFDQDDVMFCNTSFGDYPHYIPSYESQNRDDLFTGWMLLNYQKPVQVSSTLGAHYSNFAVDENIKTYWSARTDQPGEWISSDLSSVSEIFAIQINYADQDAEYLGKSSGVFHQYIIYGSIDGKKWEIMADKRNNHEDVPHDYIPLSLPKKYRYVKLENIKMPTGKFAISGFRIFGHGGMDKPDPVKNFMVLRTEKDKRSAWLKWNPVNNAYAYQIYYGTAPDKKYSSIMVYDQNEYWLKTLDALKTYYFSIEAINESGTSQQHPVVKSE
ncbi:MAG: family 43 glycosylhydrolase [Saprospiraceae bacterium]|nr:family 43 glycosylhydrolase [Candidatus Vicinibacter affinis]MBP6173816.1 family 43 glycosylhydrolase [Saprospiraceae bacterium]MBP6522700.1 family 43 glycosylhydrolase [Saprospiraceae bacterium]